MNAVDKLLLKWANGDISPSEKEELAKSYSVEELDQFINDTSSISIETSDIKEEWRRLDLEKGSQRKDSSDFKMLKWLLPIIMLMALGYWYVSSLGPNKTIENTTYEPMLIAMEDDTEVLLSPGSKLSYHESKYVDNRKMWLEGRAYFDVKKKGDFIVVTEDGIVSVLGTTFDVWELAKDRLVVQCFTGKVGVSVSGGMEGTLSAGQMFENQDGDINIKDIEKGSQPKWLSNSIVFDNTELSIVYKQLENYYPKKFVGYVSNLKFRGELPTNDLEKVTKILNAATSDIYTIEDNQVLVSEFK